MKRFDRGSLQELRSILANRPAGELELGEMRRACVLIPLIEAEDGWGLILLQRSPALTVHSGQIAFPGGAAEPDESLGDAALRETEEELGIPRANVELIGRLDDMVTISGYIVAPFIGVVHVKPEYVLQATEVAEAFEVPLEALLDPRNPRIDYIDYWGSRHPVYQYHYDNRVIWGLTGRIIKVLLDLIRLTV